MSTKGQQYPKEAGLSASLITTQVYVISPHCSSGSGRIALSDLSRRAPISPSTAAKQRARRTRPPVPRAASPDRRRSSTPVRPALLYGDVHKHSRHERHDQDHQSQDRDADQYIPVRPMLVPVNQHDSRRAEPVHRIIPAYKAGGASLHSKG